MSYGEFLILFSEIIEKVRGQSKREKFGMSFIVGESLISEALRSGSSISEIFYCNQRSLQTLSSDSLDGQKVPLHRVPTDLFNKCLNTKLPADGIMGKFLDKTLTSRILHLIWFNIDQDVIKATV